SFLLLLYISPLWAKDFNQGVQYISHELLVKFKPGIDSKQKKIVREEYGAALIKTVNSISLEQWRFSGEQEIEEVLELLKTHPDIEHAEPNYLYAPQMIPNDPEFNNLWFLQNTGQTIKDSSGNPGADISGPEAWDMETGSPDMIIAVIDSGVAFEHPDLIDNVWINNNEIPDNGLDDDNNGYIDDKYGWDFINGDNNPSDYSRDLSGDGHGTHVAGIIAAKGNNGIGTAGVMWQAKIMALQIFDIYETTSFMDTIIQNINIISAVEYAVNNGAKIINCSFGGPSDSRFQYDAYEYANNKGVLVVVAAGNENLNNDMSPIYPSNYNLPNIISVAATDEFDNLASYSNYGKNTVDVAAPGGNESFNMYSTTPPARETLFFEDFESGDDNWVKDSIYEDWALAYEPLFESTVMRDSVNNYNDNENSYFQTLTPINAENYRGLHIQFISRFRLEQNFDLLIVEGSEDGINFSIDSPVTGSISGFSNGIERLLNWGSETEIGRSFYLRFRLQSDESRNYEGISVDDIQLTGIKWEFTGNEYAFKSGTSMAAPVVSGIAGLVWSHRPNLTPLEVKNAILNSVDTSANLEGKILSSGRVNAAKAIKSVTDTLIEPKEENEEEEEDSGGGACFITIVTRQ
ncbi:S8 family peptidase, partial [Desulfobacterales bacterium HSG17]|nr:S8 family peptidase [Desulfobacterales bacterium HSG17]